MFAQTIAVLLERPVPNDELGRVLSPLAPRYVEPSGDDDAYWMHGEGSFVVPCDSGTRGGVAIAAFHRPWPDAMGDPKQDASLFAAWAMHHFGWGTYPLGLARAAAVSIAAPGDGEPAAVHDRARSVREGHAAFVRANLAYVFGAPEDARVFPDDRDVAAELRALASIGLLLLDLPGALAWFHPVGEVLRMAPEVRGDLVAQAAGELRSHLWIGRRVYSASRLAVVESVGMTALGAGGPGTRRDQQLVFPPSALELAASLDFLERLGPQATDDRAGGDELVGPAGRWRAEVLEADAPPPRELVRWTLQGEPSEGFVAPAELGAEEADRWAGHLERFLGPSSGVFHELVSDVVHLDVLRFPPRPGRPFHVLVTQGMSALPMTVPEEASDLRFAELLVAMPADWRTEGPEADEPRWYWPTRVLKFVARLPHLYSTWIGFGHTIPNGDPAEPYAPDTKLCGALVGTPSVVPEDAWQCEVAPGKTVHLWAVYAIHRDEMDLKLAEGAEALFARLAKRKVTEVVDPGRRSALAKRFFLV